MILGSKDVHDKSPANKEVYFTGIPSGQGDLHDMVKETHQKIVDFLCRPPICFTIQLKTPTNEHCFL